MSDQNKTFQESASIPIAEEYDLIVLGGGIAGVAASIAGSRQGMKTLLVEKTVLFGGLATSGIIAIYLPLCDGKGHKVAGGLCEELLYESVRYGYDSLDNYWNKNYAGEKTKPNSRYMTVFSPPEFVIAIDELLEKSGVSILLDAQFSMPVMQDHHCIGVILEDKTGRRFYPAKAFIDATGDADFMVRAGAAYESQTNWLASWCLAVDKNSIKSAIEKDDIKHAVILEENGILLDYQAPGRTYKLDNVTRFVVDGRQMIKKRLLESNKKDKTLMTLPAMADLRTTNRIIGEYTLTEEDYNRHFEDSVGVIGDWRKPEVLCEIPYRTLITKSVDNAFACGRCISSTGDAWEVTRVIPTAAVTGEASGIAAALLIKTQADVYSLDVSVLQHEIVKAHGILHFGE